MFEYLKDICANHKRDYYKLVKTIVSTSKKLEAGKHVDIQNWYIPPMLCEQQLVNTLKRKTSHHHVEYVVTKVWHGNGYMYDRYISILKLEEAVA